MKRLAAVLLSFLAAAVARADLPSVLFGRLTPLGGGAGSTVDVEVSGADMEGVKTLLFDHPGLKANFLKDAASA